MTPLPWNLDHIGIAVADLEESIKNYVKVGSFKLTLREELSIQGVKVAFLSTEAGADLELLQSTREDSALGRFMAKKGPGLHHICYKVSDIAQELKHLVTQGFQLIDKTPRAGSRETLIAFLHPSSFSGTLIELCQHKLG